MHCEGAAPGQAVAWQEGGGLAQLHSRPRVSAQAPHVTVKNWVLIAVPLTFSLAQRKPNKTLKSVYSSFLAALSSSRRLVVCWLVGLSVCLSVGWSGGVCGGVCEKVTYRVSNGN